MGFFRRAYKKWKKIDGGIGIGFRYKKNHDKKKARDQRQRRLSAAELALTRTRGDIASGYGQAEGSLFKAMGVLGGAYDDARGEVSGAGAKTKRQINYQAGQTYKEGAANFTKQGFGDAALLKQFRSGVMNQSGRQIGAVDDGFAQLHSELLRRKGVGLAESQSRISRLKVERTKALLGAAKSQYNLAVGLDLPEYQPSTVDLGGLTAFLGSLGGGA